MIKKILQSSFSVFILAILLGITPSAFAVENVEHKIELERFDNMLISPIFEEEKPFNIIAIQSPNIIEGLMVNFNPYEGGYWRPVEMEDDGFGPEAMIFNQPSTTVQFKKISNSKNEKVVLNTTFFFYEPEVEAQLEEEENLIAGSTQYASRSLRVISRRSWGADESLRYWNPDSSSGSKNGEKNTYISPCKDYATKYSGEIDKIRVVDHSPSGESLIWPLQYIQKIKKIVIHHTDSEIRDVNGDHRTDTRDYKAIVRAIYHYHTVTRGWGDIGYNYLIDPLGNVYEGRYGGDKVIGAHVLCHNNGALGISVIGNYEDNHISEPSLMALISLVAKKSKELRLNPTGTSSFRGKMTPNIIGHRDLRATACPGKNLYALLPKIRERAALSIRSGSFKEGGLSGGTVDYNAEIVGQIATVRLKPNEKKKIAIRFKNKGNKTWDGNTWLHVEPSTNPRARIIPIIEDKKFVAADLKERSVRSGQTGTFEIELEAGYFGGDYKFNLTPVINGRYKISQAVTPLSFNVKDPIFSYEIVSKDLPKGNVFQGQKITSIIELKNTGNVVWRNYGTNQITLGTESPRDHKSIFVKKRPARVGYLINSEVYPGKTGKFELTLEVPIKKTGKVIERFTPVVERVRWLEKNDDLRFEVTIKEPIHLASMKKLNQISEMIPGEMKKIEIEMENKGDLAWNSENMQVTVLGRGIKVFKKKLTPLKTVGKNRKVKFEFWIQAPYKEGKHSIFLRSKFNNIPIRGGATRYLINIKKPVLRAKVIEQKEKTVQIRPGQIKEMTVKIKNLGNIVWQNKGENAVYLAPSSPRDRLSKMYYEKGWVNKFRAGKMVESVIMPGETGTFKFKVKPNYTGTKRENFQLVVEKTGWMIGSNVTWLFKISGDRVNVRDTEDIDENKKRAALITRGRTAAIEQRVKTTTSSTTKTTTTTKTYQTPVSEKLFRVRLSYEDSASKITANKTFKVVDGDNKILFSIGANKEVSLRKVGNNIHIQYGSVSKSSSIIRFITGTDGVVEITTMERRPSWNTKLNDNKFRGTMEVRVINNKIAYINELPLEDYLKGLGEVSNSASFEKQKIIAVLARSYARFYMKDENRKFPGLPYDGNDDPAVFQKYLGYGIEARSPNFLGAVSITEDEVVTYNGELVKTPYFNQSDGKTRSAKEVWGWTHTPYLQAVDDPYCKGMARKGHGVGLSGYGASKMAEKGETYDDIIKYYYKGVKVEEMKFQ